MASPFRAQGKVIARWLPLLAITPVVAALAAVACTTTPNGSTSVVDAGAEAAPLETPDVGVPVVPATPSSFFQSCSAGSCPSGYICFAGHTSPNDVHGECTVQCTGDDGPLCTVNGGACVCPTPGNCTMGNDAGDVTVCAPAGDAGPPNPGTDSNDAGFGSSDAATSSDAAKSGDASDAGADGSLLDGAIG